MLIVYKYTKWHKTACGTQIPDQVNLLSNISYAELIF